ncbi:hypothetical protein [Sphingopyxis macrogoltabida]|uniref:hypothetical protein n=1 Tax=Sphingopyxis macrogoltabida TaxID=33050 RepID=UPI0006CA6417|nr:hypothetical protein [Sphingopyxis macrogoltabida]
MSLFGPRRPLSAAEWEWQLAAFRWLLDEHGGLAAHRGRILAAPDGSCFPDSRLTGDERARELLGQVMAIAGIADWPVRLVMVDGGRAHMPVGDRHAVVHAGASAAGTFQLVEDGAGGWLAEIVAARSQLADEAALVATLGHETAHYWMTVTRRAAPGGPDCEELLTDLVAVALGFGIFLGNNARYGYHTAAEADQVGGWYLSGSQGYLSERALMTALAVSEALAGRDPLTAVPYLKPHLAADLRDAARYVAKRDIVADIMSIDLADYGSPPEQAA